MVNETIAILINHVERLLKLLDLILIKHSKDIRSGPLGPLLSPRPTGGFTTRHGCLEAEGAGATHAPRPKIKNKFLDQYERLLHQFLT